MEPDSTEEAGKTVEAVRPAVLLVDDDEQIREILRRILQRHHDVTEVESADAAREKLATQQFGIVLCDIRMAGTSGMDLLREIAASKADVAVVMVTGVDDPRVADEALTLGAYGYLLKPFTPSQVIITVASALRRREAERARAEAEERERLHQLIAERDRIATHLYSEVVHDLFGVSMALTGTAKLVNDADLRDRVLTCVQEVDAIIKRIRSTILNPAD
jgi:putative two-component system response regulator